jgi:hypothetical protein
MSVLAYAWGRRRSGQLSPFKLACPFLPTTMWSCTAMPSELAMSMTGLGHLDVGLRERGIAGGVVVQ